MGGRILRWILRPPLLVRILRFGTPWILRIRFGTLRIRIRFGIPRILWPWIRIRVWPTILWWILWTPLWIWIRILRLKTILECNILPFFKQPPFGAFETYTTALCNITENCVFYEKIV